ncbi:MAG: HlyC/CorC family transporter [Pseudomonadota bacterium]
MDDINTGALFVALGLLLLCSAFFSGSETALMALNRYRLRHRAKSGHRGARYAQQLLKQPDRLIGVILLGNNLANILATQLATYIGYRLSGEIGVAVATGALVVVMLIFSELTPKTLAAVHSEKVAYPASYAYRIMMSRWSPMTWIAWVINLVANGLLRMLGINPTAQTSLALDADELKSVLNEGGLIPRTHQEMLGNVLDLEQVTVDDIMVPRNELVGIDLEDEWDDIVEQVTQSQHTRLPVYRESIDNIIGFIHLRKVLFLMHKEDFNRENFESLVREAYYVPEGTTLTKQLLSFQLEKRRVGLVVDEYGDIQGLITLEDILEEIVGEFTTDPLSTKEIFPQHDGSFIVDGGTNLRDINKALNWSLPTDGPRTLNGMITEHMEMIPESGTSLQLHGHTIEVVIAENNAIKTARLFPTNHKRSRRAARKS